MKADPERSDRRRAQQRALYPRRNTLILSKAEYNTDFLELQRVC